MSTSLQKVMGPAPNLDATTIPSDPPPPIASKIPDLPSNVDPNSEEVAALYGDVTFIARTFSHASPTRDPGDAIRMHSILNTFFQTPVSGEEKKTRIQERISGSCLFWRFSLLQSFNCTAAEHAQNMQKPSQYLLTVTIGQVIEDDYPVPSYLADVCISKDRGVNRAASSCS
jgi:RNA exonuclease 1